MKNLVEGVIQELHDVKESIDDIGERVDGSLQIDEVTLRRLYYAIGKAEAVLFAMAYERFN